MTTPQFHTKFTSKNFPVLRQHNAPAEQASCTPASSRQTAPAMIVKPSVQASTTTPVPTTSASHSPPILTASSTASTSSGILATDDADTVAPASTHPGASAAQALIQAMDTFRNGEEVSLTGFLGLCQSLKDLQESVHFSELKRTPEYPAVAGQLANALVAFWTFAEQRVRPLFSTPALNMSRVAGLSYALKACIELDKAHDFFTPAQWGALRPAICRLMRGLINAIHQRQLLAGLDPNRIGAVLALLAWITAGMRHAVPSPVSTAAPGEDAPAAVSLLSGFSRHENQPSLADTAQAAIDCLLRMAPNALDTRQVGKMLMSFARLLKTGLLGAPAPGSSLANGLIALCNTGAMTMYSAQQHTYASGYVDPVVVDNICEGVQALFKHQILHWQSKAHVAIAIKVANLITKAMTGGGGTHSRNEARYRNFLEQALAHLPAESRAAFLMAKEKLPAT